MKGILFKPEIWKAKQRVLEQYGEAQTRRLDGLKEINKAPHLWQYYPSVIATDTEYFLYADTKRQLSLKPRYLPGDVGYVKETWSTLKQYDSFPPRAIPKDSPIWFLDAHMATSFAKGRGKWRFPMFMPAWAARSLLQITAVRPERLNIGQMASSEIQAEGGLEAVIFLQEYDGKWVWAYTFKREDNPLV